MTFNDLRTKSDDQVSFYVWDDLRYKQNGRTEYDIFRFDTLEEAIAKYRELPDTMTTALGMHRNKGQEYDLIHRREGETVLVPDYLRSSAWRTDPVVLEAVEKVKEEFSVQWQYDAKCVGETILVPLDNFTAVPDPCFNSKNLRPQKPLMPWTEKESPLTAINEAYVVGEGWMEFKPFFDKASGFGYNNPHCLKVERFNVNYIDENKHTGQADMSPLDLQILRERYTLQHGEKYDIGRIVDDLAERIAEISCSPSSDIYPEYLDNLKKSFSRGDTSGARESLELLLKYPGSTESEHVNEKRLLTRLNGLSVLERKPSLDQQVSDAAHKAEQQKKNDPNKGLTEPER